MYSFPACLRAKGYPFMKKFRVRSFIRRAIAAFLCVNLVGASPAYSVLAEQPTTSVVVSSTTDAASVDEVNDDTVSSDAQPASSPTPSPEATPPDPSEGVVVLPDASPSPAPSISPENTPVPDEEIQDPGVDSSDSVPDTAVDFGAESSWAGEQMQFVDLLWKTDPLSGVDAVFTGEEGQEPAVLTMTEDSRGLFFLTVPEGGYDAVAFYPSGQAGEAEPLGGVWHLSDSSGTAADTVAFNGLTLSAFYYDSGDNPSYWGSDPTFDPSSANTMLLADGDSASPRTTGSPEPGDQVYFVNLHALDGTETDPILTVEARFIQLPHGGTDDPGWTNGDQYLARTMYEVHDGVYVAPFPKQIDDTKEDGSYLYQEISFDLTRQSGQKDSFNRHYNFRGQRTSNSDIEGTWGVPGWFSYDAGHMDAYYYNTSVEDSYWNAHPSTADQSIQGMLLYIDTRDFSTTEGGKPYQHVSDIYLSWDGMPENLEQYEPGLGVRLGISGPGGDNTHATATEGIYYFKMPAEMESLTENTVFTLTYIITEGELVGTHTFLFTYVPRSGRDTILMDYLWEDVGEVWGTYQANPPESDTRNVYFNNAVTAFGKVEVAFGKEDATGSITWMDGKASENADWAKEKLANDNGSATDYSNWTYGWLTMSPASKSGDGHSLPANVWSFNDVPEGYTHVMFRGSINANASDALGKDFYFSPWLTIDGTYVNPCFFAYQYINTTKEDGAANSEIKLGNTRFLDGVWGSALEQYSLGDNSVSIPSGTFETQDNTYYGTATLYDYYSLWEMSGHPLNELTNSGNDKHYGRQGVLFNLAVSEYYEQLSKTTSFEFRPLYFGADNMRNEYYDSTPGWIYQLSSPASNLSKYGTLYKTQQLYNNTDHANVWEGNDGSRTGLVDRNLNADNELTIGNNLTPYFSESFLRGNNALGITLGNVYNNIQFPFRLNADGYWEYDSAEEGRTLKQSSDGTYFMDKTNTFYLQKNDQAVASYMPFHEATGNYAISSDAADMNYLNYMFGQRLDITFTVPEGGQVNMPTPDQEENLQDIIFEFVGDDDCWVFIDGELILDMGGIHDSVRGTINFADGRWTTYRDLDDQNGPESDGNGTFRLSGDASTTHTLTMFYMERGLYASNLKMTFNFPQQNTLRVTKQVDTSEVNSLFNEAIANLGGFEMNLDTLATSGDPLAVENSAGYIQTKTQTLYDPKESVTPTTSPPVGGSATTQTDSSNGLTYLEIKQPSGWSLDKPPDTFEEWKNYLLTIQPADAIDLTHADGADGTGDPLAFLELELYNNTENNRGAELYIQLEDSAGHLVTGTARTLGYLGEANLFLPNTNSLIRIDLNTLTGTNPNFDKSSVKAVRIGLLNGTGSGDSAGDYRLYRAVFGTEWNRVINTGFSVGDDQISDYGSITAGDYQPANGAWYTRQTYDDGGAITESVSSMVQDGTFSLADNQTAVFTDKFRVGSYIQLQENVDTDLFDTTWSIREDGEPVSFNSLLPDRPDVLRVINPDWGYSRGENPLENQVDTKPNDGRLESGVTMTNKKGDFGFVYRSYLYPDNNENLPINLEVVFTNRLRVGSFTIVKQLNKSMLVGDRYPVGTYTYDIYYTDVAGRGLEQYLPDQADVKGIGTRYIHQVVQITTDENGRGSFTMTGIPSGTNYIIRERPSNGATLVGLTASPESTDVIKGVVGQDYSGAYIQSEVRTSDGGMPVDHSPVYTFENKNESFYMQIEKIWEGPPPVNVKEIHIQVQRRPAGSKDESAWQNVTKNYFGEFVGEDNTIVLKPDENGDWISKQSQKVDIFPTQGTEQNQTVLYEYRIVELGVGQGDLAGYQVTYDEIRSDTTTDGPAVITYRAINSPTGLTLQKTWLDNNNRDQTRPSAVRVLLQRSNNYDPKNPTADGVRWEIINSQGSVESGTSDAAYITLQSPTWTYTLEGLPASDAAGSTYYYRLQEVQIQVDNQWVDMTTQNTYEPVYSQPVTLSESAVLTVENGLKTASIKITKQDAQNSSKLLSGAKFTLNRLMQTESGSWIVDTSWSPLEGQTGGPESADGNGVLLFENLRPGRYRLTETQAPEGYVASFAPIDITLEADDLGQTIPVTVKNNTPLTFQFTKIAAEDHTKTLAGASFTLYPLVCTDASHTHNDLLDPDNPGPCWGVVKRLTVSSDEKGLVQFSNLPAGTYRLVETKAPPGYALPTGQWQIQLDASGTAKFEGIGNPPAFLSTGTNNYQLPNRTPMTMPSSGGPGVPLAAALGVLMMGGGLTLTTATLRSSRRRRRKYRKN